MTSRELFTLISTALVASACGGNRAFQTQPEAGTVVTGMDGGTSVVPDGGTHVEIPDGATVSPDGAIVLADGAVFVPDDTGTATGGNDGGGGGNDGGTVFTNPCDDPGSNLGCEFWPTVTPNSQLDPQFSFAVVFANPGSTDATVTIEGGGIASPVTRTIAAGSVQSVNLPWVFELSQNSVACYSSGSCLGVSARGRASGGSGAFHVHSDAPIAAWQYSPLEYRTGTVFSYTADASLLLPQVTLGTRYVVSTAANWTSTSSFTNVTLGGFVSIVATGAPGTSTTLTLELSAAVIDPDGGTTTGPDGGVVRTIGPGTVTRTLAAGDVLQFVGATAGQSLTGTVITASRPVAVFAGHDCADIPADRAACDHLEEQLVPVAAWGRRVVVTALHDRPASTADGGTLSPEFSVVRVMAAQDGTTLAFTGITAPPACAATLAANASCEFQTTGNFQVNASGPIQVTQFMSGLGDAPECAPAVVGGAPPDLPQCVGDPAMVLEVPVEQFRNRTDVLVPSTYSRNFVNVVSPSGTTVLVDGTATTVSATTAGTGFETRTIPLVAGSHTIAAEDTAVQLGVKLYGVASYTSYMAPGGMGLRALR